MLRPLISLPPLLAVLATPALAQTSPPPDPATTLPQVTVTGAARATQPGALREDIVTTESINAKEMARSGATNLPELMKARPGIDVQVECSVCNVRNITLNNLPGRFTTLLLDGVPIFSSVSNAYGLDMIGLIGLERVDISRGAGTSLIAPESLAGTVNLVTKRPVRDGGELDLSLGNHGYWRGAATASKMFEGAALTINGTLTQHDSVDGVGTGVSQYTGYDRKLFGAGLFVDDAGGFKLKARFDHIDEKRMGGPLGHNYDAVRSNTSGNPFDFSQGPNASPDRNSWIKPSDGTLVPAYDDGAFGLAQIIFTHRDQFVGSADRQFGDTKLHLALGYAQHKQDSWYGGDADYFGKQKQFYAEASVQTTLADTLWTVGLNQRYEDLHSQSCNDPLNCVLVTDADAYTYRTPGVFVQAYRALFDERLEVNVSLRHDRNNVYGGITTPRVNLLWHHSDSLSSRIALGQGYRLPTSFFELEHAVLQASGVDRSQAKAEKSNNLSYALNYADDRVTFTTSLNHTAIKNLALFVDDPANPGGLLLAPAPSRYTVSGIDALGTLQLTAQDTLSLGLEHYRYRFNASDFQGSLFARPAWRGSLAFNHTAGAWDFNFRTGWTGTQDLAKFYDYADTPRYNVDGSAKPGKSPAFWVADVHGSYQWTNRVSTYASINNLFNYQQAKKDSFLWLDRDGAIDVTHVWGPSLGRSWNAGVKVAF